MTDLKNFVPVRNTAVVAGGAVVDTLGSGTAPQILIGSGAPSLAANQGSLYLRTDGGASTELYVNRDGSTTWKAVTTAA